MLPIADQSAGPNGLKFFVDTQGWLGSVLGFKKFEICLKHFFNIFYEQRQALQLVIYKIKRTS